MHRIAKLFTLVALGFLATAWCAFGRAPHVVVLIWDGMRPDFVSETNTPTLARLARQGVAFSHHHPVYISSTEVNGTAIATGAYPELSGIIGNKEFRPAIEPAKPIMTASLAAVRRGDELNANKFLGYPTVAETLHAHRLESAIAGAKTVTLLHDRRAGDTESLGIDVFEGNVLPQSMAPALTESLGKFPPVGLPKRERDLWTTRALIGPLWQKGVPAFSLLWLSEPDFSQHETGPGSAVSLEALKSCDDNLAQVLSALDQRNLRDQTDVIVVSDHGFSTIAHNVDLAHALKEQGFKAARNFPPKGGQAGEILVVGNGGTVFFYVVGHEPALVEKLAHYLQTQPFSGVLFTRLPLEGAFRLEAAKINSTDAPDIVLSLHWSAGLSKNGTPGLIDSDYSEYGPGQGMHASLSPFDMHNTCIAAGPDFRKGFVDDLPSGNIDIAPTVLSLLQVQPAQQLSGRVLTEALANSTAPPPTVQHHRLEATCHTDHLTWRQYLGISEVDGVSYFDEGNGEQSPHHDLGGN